MSDGRLSLSLLTNNLMGIAFKLLVKMGEQPEPPTEIPAYVVDGLQRQDRESLRAVKEYVDELLKHLQREIQPEEVVDEGEEIVDVDEDEKGVIVKKMIPCGKDCGGCPHGPYEYRAYREGDKVKTEYLGTASG